MKFNYLVVNAAGLMMMGALITTVKLARNSPDVDSLDVWPLMSICCLASIALLEINRRLKVIEVVNASSDSVDKSSDTAG